MNQCNDYRVTITSPRGGEQEVFAHVDSETATEYYRYLKKSLRRGDTLQLYRGETLLRTLKATMGRAVKPDHGKPHTMFL